MSRVLDDIEELLVPAAFAIGGLYLLYWITQSTERAIDYVTPDSPFEVIGNIDLPFVGEDDFIDRWTLNPREVRYELGRLKNWGANLTGRFL